jgi:hypothetical protein
MELENMSVEKINSTKGREFILENHYSGSCHGGPMCWGAFDGEKNLVGVCAFATPISENVRKSIWNSSVEDEMKNHTTELHRLVTYDGCPKNTETWFISRALKGLKNYKSKYKAVISFADSTENHDGTIYQASNAIYYGKTGTATFYRDGEGNLRAPRQGGVNIDKEEAKSRGWKPEKRGRKHRYLFLLPDEYESKDDIKKLLDINEKEYP